MAGIEDIFRELELETEEERERFVYGDMTHEDELNINGLGLSTYSG